MSQSSVRAGGKEKGKSCGQGRSFSHSSFDFDFEADSVPSYSLEDLDDLGVTSEFGSPRRWNARRELLPGLKGYPKSGVPKLVGVYRGWKNFVEYGLMKLTVFERKPGKSYKEFKKERVVGVKCSKRGNDKFRKEKRGKFNYLYEEEDIDSIWNRVFVFRFLFRSKEELGKYYEPEVVSDNELFDKGERNVTTNAALVTLTVDPGKFELLESWESASSYFNSWITNVRAKYGKVKYLKVYEAMKNGYIHLHLVMFFKDKEFSVKWINGKARIEGRKREGNVWDSWNMGFVDVKAVRKPKGSLQYIVKYLFKEPDNKEEKLKQDLMYALTWILGSDSNAMNTYFCSRELREYLTKTYDLILSKRNSKSGLVRYQESLTGDQVSKVEFEWLGVYSLNELPFEGDSSPDFLKIGLSPDGESESHEAQHMFDRFSYEETRELDLDRVVECVAL